MKDVDQCIRLAKQENKEYWSRPDFEKSVENAIFLVAEIDNIVVGYIIGFIVPTKN
ncbi:MAG: hypothetical protein ACLFP2_04115 [Candidatus Woesearchaeota archaeon]